MKIALRRLLNLPLHPFLLSIYPVLALLAFNLKEMQPRAGLRALLISFVAIAALFLLVWALTRRSLHAGLITTLFAILFFSYGHVYAFASGMPVLKVILGKQSILGPLWIVLFGLGILAVMRKGKDLQRFTAVLNVFAIVLLVMPAFQMVAFSIQSRSSASQVAGRVPVLNPLTAQPGQPLPDVYFIILDTYARQDLLQEQMLFDNAGFIAQLEQLGFTVARCSQSNYTQTEMSLASILNLNYLPQLDSRFQSGYMDRSELPAFIKESLARRSLQQLGYQTVSFGTGYAWSEIRDADIFYYPGSDGLTWVGHNAAINQFEALFLRTTGALTLELIKSPAVNDWTRVVNHPFQDHINIQLFLLDTLDKLPAVSGPKFVFTHILIPHGPFVFGPEGVLPIDQMIGSREEDGSDLKTETYVKGYVPNLEYINNRILPILKDLIQKSKTPPIIILQGDHGPFSLPPILNAYYLPGGKDAGIYPSITPVNSFRMVFNAYFGTHYPLLPDVSLESFDADPYGGTVYPNTCR